MDSRLFYHLASKVAMTPIIMNGCSSRAKSGIQIYVCLLCLCSPVRDRREKPFSYSTQRMINNLFSLSSFCIRFQLLIPWGLLNVKPTCLKCWKCMVLCTRPHELEWERALFVLDDDDDASSSKAECACSIIGSLLPLRFSTGGLLCACHLWVFNCIIKQIIYYIPQDE